MTQRMKSASKFAAISLAIAAAVAMPLSASAHGWGGHGWGHHGGYHGRYYGHGYGHGYGHWSGGRWIAGAIVTGAVIGLVDDVLHPRPVYYDPPVVYSQPRTVIYEDAPPVVERRVIVHRTVVYDDPQQTRYVRDDGYDQDDGH